MEKLLLSPYHHDYEGPGRKQGRRSLYREDLGYGLVVGSQYYGSSPLWTDIKLFDFPGFEGLWLRTAVILNVEGGLTDDRSAYQSVEMALEFALEEKNLAFVSAWEAADQARLARARSDY